MSDPLEGMFDDFADATEKSLARMAEQIQSFRAEIETLRTEQRTAPVLATQSIDTEAIATRAAALVPPVDIESIVKRVVELVPKPENGKDAVIDYDKLAEGVRAILAPMVTAEVSKIPAVDLHEVAIRAAALVPAPKNGEDGADGVATREEIEELVERKLEARYSEIQVRTIADSYQDVYKHGQTYNRGVLATWDGSLWLSLRDTDRQPGTTDSGWKLVTKKGRDGRDARR